MTSQKSILLIVLFQKGLGHYQRFPCLCPIRTKGRDDSVNISFGCDKGRTPHSHMISLPIMYFDNSNIATEYLIFSLIALSNF